MKLTICLVTRGRSQFLGDCLLGLEECLHTGLAEVLLFDNGAPLEVSQTLETWCRKNNVEYIRYDENDSRPTRVWNEVRSRGFTWVVFPGDDDKFIASSLRIFKDTAGQNSNEYNRCEWQEFASHSETFIPAISFTTYCYGSEFS